MPGKVPPTLRCVGQSPTRTDGLDKVTGKALFVDDLIVEGMWHGATVRCPHPHARINRIDPTPARAADPDVVVVTATDLPGPNCIRVLEDDWPALAEEVANHAFEAVALVAAPTRERAQAAARAVAVEYEPLAAVTTLDEALAADSLRLLSRCDVNHGDWQQAFAEADRIVEGTYQSGLHEHIYLECQGMLAFPCEGDGVDVIGSLQCPYFVRNALAHLFAVAPERVRVRQAVTGGGFGGKEDFPDILAGHAALLSRATERPVKIIYDRHEDIAATPKRHPSRIRIRTAVANDGKLLAHDIDVVFDGGAYVTLSPVVLSRGVLHAAGPYACPNVRIRGRAVATNTPPSGAFRGFGAPQTQLALERHMDRIARTLGIDPLAIRERNAYKEGDITPTGQTLDHSTSARLCLQEAARRTRFKQRWQEHERARANRRDDGKPWRGIGLSLCWHGAGFTGNGEQRIKARAQVALTSDGDLEVRVASTDVGQGTLTVFPQIVADTVGLSQERVHMAPVDTDRVPDSGPTVASRTVMVVGGVVARAAQGLEQKLRAFLAKGRGLEPLAVHFTDEQYRRGSDGAPLATFAEAAKAYLEEHGALVVEEQYKVEADAAFDEETHKGVAYATYGWGCDVVEVEMDSDTLATAPARLTAVCDVGRVIHRRLCQGQVEGGTLQAVAWGYMEEIKLAEGRWQNDRLATYIIPTSRDVPEMDTVLLENPAPVGPFGAKGVGELPMDAGAPALLQAIENASGIVVNAVPATPERLLQLRDAGNSVDDAAGTRDRE